jgi:heptosyltransferase III
LKILLMRAGALGDSLMLMPSIRALGKGNELIFAGRLPAIDYIKPYVDQCIDMESSGWHRLFMKAPCGPFNLEGSPPDHIIAFLNDSEGIVSDNLRACFPESIVNVFPVFPSGQDERHIALYMAQSIQDSGLPIDAQRCLNDSLAVPLMVSEVRQSNGEGPVVIHPGSGSQKKNYPPLYWVQVVRELKRSSLDNSKKIILLIGPAEEDMADFFRGELDEKSIDLNVLPEREELISIINNASVYIGHDSGVTHLAAMLGKPVIALFKDSPVARWRPLGPDVRIIAGSHFQKTKI